MLLKTKSSPPVRLNTADRVGENTHDLPINPFAEVVKILLFVLLLCNPGNTPLHLAMDSGYAEVAVLLIDKGADRTRVSVPSCIVFGMKPFIYLLVLRKIWMVRLRRAFQEWEVASNIWPENMLLITVVNHRDPWAVSR